VVATLRYVAAGWGVGELWVDGDRVLWHELPRPGAHAGGERTAAHPITDDLRRYFRGEPVDFDEIEIDFRETTPFQRRLAEALRAVPRGEVVTYGELAALAGHPGAARAAGTFCARNPLPLFIPCHRVVAVSGIGAYGRLGPEYKRRLLALERSAAGAASGGLEHPEGRVRAPADA
jgi:methylated-DNA-[protein]-cysteine S-methyltransferase